MARGFEVRHSPGTGTPGIWTIHRAGRHDWGFSTPLPDEGSVIDSLRWLAGVDDQPEADNANGWQLCNCLGRTSYEQAHWRKLWTERPLVRPESSAPLQRVPLGTERLESIVDLVQQAHAGRYAIGHIFEEYLFTEPKGQVVGRQPREVRVERRSYLVEKQGHELTEQHKPHLRTVVSEANVTLAKANLFDVDSVWPPRAEPLMRQVRLLLVPEHAN